MKEDEKSAKKVFDGVLYEVYHWQQTEFDGSQKTYEKVVRKTATVEVIGVSGGKVLLIEEEQPHWDAPGLCLPSGKMELGEDPLQTAKRELQEETGLEFDSWEHLDDFGVPGKVEHTFHIYLARDVIGEHVTAHEAGERIKPLWVSVDEFIRLVRQGELRYPPKVIERLLLSGGDQAVQKLLTS